MSHISEIRTTLSSDQRKLLADAGLDETNFVRGLVADALKEMANKAVEESEEEDEPTPEEEEEEEEEEESSEDDEK